RGHPAVFGFYANKQMTTGEGGIVTMADDELKERIDSERNQGRAPDMGWLDHDRLGFNYRLSDIACALGLAQLERLDDVLAARARGQGGGGGWRGGGVSRGAGGDGGAGSALCGRRGQPPRVVRVRGPASAGRGPRRLRARPGGARGSEQAVFPCRSPDDLLPGA